MSEHFKEEGALSVEAEARLAELLEEGEMERLKPEAEAPRHLSPRYEVRMETEGGPVIEETEHYRRMAKEIDGRYDRYVPRDNR